MSEANGKKRVFISYRNRDPDTAIAEGFFDALEQASMAAFMAGKSIRLGENWAQRIDDELRACDYFLVLLSEQSGGSEMVIEEVRIAKGMQGDAGTGKPMILPIRVNLPMDVPLNYDLRSYLQRIQQGHWTSQQDTARLVAEIASLSGEAGAPPAAAPPTRMDEVEEDAEEEIETPAVVDSGDRPPSPSAEPELPGGGQVDLTSAFYVARPPHEESCFREIEKSGALIRIKAPRQMGKTSLMARILHHAKSKGFRTVPLSFQIADAKIFSDLDHLLRWLCAIISRRLKISPRQITEYWDDIFGPKDNCSTYFEEVLLPEVDGPLVLAFDEVDRIFDYPEIAEEFLSLLRVWHEDAKTDDLWRNLRLVVVHSTEVYIPMNINQSPFNVGLPVALPEFDQAQIQDLASRHGLSLSADDLAEVARMVGGHPFLCRVCFYEMARSEVPLSEIMEAAATEEGFFADHLRRIMWHLEKYPELAEGIRKVVQADGKVRLGSVDAFKLRSIGLVHLEGNDVSLRCDLYRLYLRDRMV